MVMDNVTAGSLGSHRGPGVSSWRAYCLWILRAPGAAELARRARLGWRNEPGPTVTFMMEDLAVQCERVGARDFEKEISCEICSFKNISN